MYLNMEDHNSEKLEEVAIIVLNAENPIMALNDLEISLSSEYKKPILVLKTILSDNENSEYNDLQMPKNNNLFSLLVSLAHTGEQPIKSYLPQYSLLMQAKTQLSALFKQSWGGVSYFTFLFLIYAIVMIIYRTKVLPVFAEFFTTNGVPLPEFTQHVLMSAWFLVLTDILIFIAFVYACILPYWLKESISRLKKIPKILLFLPTTWSITQIYYQYLWVIFTKIYLQSGENEASLTTDKYLMTTYNRKPSINKIIGEDQWALLQAAERYGSLNKVLDTMETKLLNQLKTRIKTSGTAITLILFLMLAYLLVMPVLAMYMPIFQMGNIMK